MLIFLSTVQNQRLRLFLDTHAFTPLMLFHCDVDLRGCWPCRNHLPLNTSLPGGGDWEREPQGLLQRAMQPM